jgi:hypothetical protein
MTMGIRHERRLIGAGLLAGMLGAHRLAWAQAQPREAGKSVGGYRTATWEELIPKDWDPRKTFRDRNPGRIVEGSPEEQALMRELREAWDNAPTRADLNGARVRLPGFVVPLELGAGTVREFLLVPYFGACIHSPPPPANQIIHVTLTSPKPLRTMDAVWASGVLRTQRRDSSLGVSGYSMEAAQAEPYKAPGS